MTPAKSLRPIVWTMSPTVDPSGNAQFPWDYTKWQVENRLVPVSSSTSVGSEGSASFRLLRRSVIQDGASEYTDQVSSFRVGCYVMITTGTNTVGTATAPTETPDLATLKWFGVITSTDFETAGSYDYIGSVTAREVGAAILDTLRVTGWRQADAQTNPYPLNLGDVVCANIKSDSASPLIGNAKLGTDGSSHPAYLFARELTDLGSDTAADQAKYWTPWRLACHMVQFCVPAGLPALWINVESSTINPITYTDPLAYTFPGAPGAGLLAWIDDPKKSVAWDLEGLTWKGALDLLFNPGTGLGWRLDLADSGGTIYWRITIISRSAASSQFGPPKASSQSYVVNNDKTVSVAYAEDDSSLYDEVIVQGSPLLFGVSVSPLDGNLDQAWNAQQETDYGNAVGTERAQTKFENVFSSFVLKRATAGNGITRSASAGTGGATLPLTPLVSWDASKSVAKIEANNRDQYLPTLTLSSDVPFLEGLGWDGTTTPNAVIDKTPKYIKPQIYYYDSAAPAVKWKDLLTRISTASVSPFSESPQVDLPANRPAITVKYSRPHTLGLGTFVSTDTGGQAATFDWRKLVCTIGIWSDQKLEVRRKRIVNGIDVATVRRQLIIKDPSFKFHATLAGTVVGLSADNTGAKVVNGNKIIVNDYAAAQSYCDELWSWSCRPKASASVVIVNDGSTSAYLPGDSLHQVVDNGVGRIIDGLIAVIETDWTAQRVTIQTELPPQPMRGTGSPSPSRGGTVSTELGGTLAQVVQRNQADQSKTAAGVAARPLIPMMGGGAATTPSPLYQVLGGNALTYLGKQGIVRRTDTVLGSELPAGTGGASGDIIVISANSTPAGLPNGVGVAQNLVTGAYVFVVLDATTSASMPDLVRDDILQSTSSINLDRVVSGVTYRYVCFKPFAGWW